MHADLLALGTTAPIQPGDLLTPAEVSEVLRVPPTTLANWRALGNKGPPFIKIGERMVRYRRVDLISFIEGTTADEGNSE